VASQEISEEDAVSKVKIFSRNIRMFQPRVYELSGVIDYTEFGKWRMIFSIEDESSAVKIDIDRAGNLADSNNLKS
jgi:hypothetical protein